MPELVILCVEDEPEVRESLVRDLEPFAGVFRIEAAEDAAEAREVIEECADAGDAIALALCDHLLPGENGVSLMVDMRDRPETAATRKVLVTGQAGLEDTIEAVNRAGLNHYIAKPWEGDHLRETVRAQLTDYVIDEEDDLLDYVQVLDGPRLMEAMRGRE